MRTRRLNWASRPRFFLVSESGLHGAVSVLPFCIAINQILSRTMGERLVETWLREYNEFGMKSCRFSWMITSCPKILLRRLEQVRGRLGACRARALCEAARLL